MDQNSNGNFQNLLEAMVKDNPKIKKGAHGLNSLEMKEIKNSQSFGNEPEFIQANKSEDYQVPVYEAHMIHVLLEKTRFDEKTGQRLSKPILQKFYVNDFEKMSSVVSVKGGPAPENAFRDMDVTIIHDPRLSEGKVEKKQSIHVMSIEDLRETYRSLYNDEPSMEDGRDVLITLIEEKTGKKKAGSPEVKKAIQVKKKPESDKTNTETDLDK